MVSLSNTRQKKIAGLPFFGPKFLPPHPSSFKATSLSSPPLPSNFKLKAVTIEHPVLYYNGNESVFRCAGQKACGQRGLEGFVVHDFKNEGPRTVYGIFENELALGVVLKCRKCEGRTVMTSYELWKGIPLWEVPSE